MSAVPTVGELQAARSVGDVWDFVDASLPVDLGASEKAPLALLFWQGAAAVTGVFCQLVEKGVHPATAMQALHLEASCGLHAAIKAMP